MKTDIKALRAKYKTFSVGDKVRIVSTSDSADMMPYRGHVGVISEIGTWGDQQYAVRMTSGKQRGYVGYFTEKDIKRA